MQEKKKVCLTLFSASDIGVNVCGNLHKHDLTINSTHELTVKLTLDSLIWALQQFSPEIRDEICLQIDPANDD